MANSQESAVSPVVGVMLMLVVVIIIAAIVSGFAGGMVGTETKPPQATIQGTYSLSANILQMYHAGGDELPTQKLLVQVYMNDEDFGGYGGMFKGVHTIANKSVICTAAGKCWLNAATGLISDVPVWRPGETMYFNQTVSAYQKFDSKDDPVGKSLILEVLTIDGKLISKSKVMIDP
jgi:FlaG/FlaF family flagellin (archaellin)